MDNPGKIKRITLFAGHYGSGKTNLAVNYALYLAGLGKKTSIADLDIVNPYFRTRDSEAELEKAGVHIIVSPYANSNVDVPALPDEMYAVTQNKSRSFIVDVGGDDRGALALGRLSPDILEENDWQMFMVVNFYRPLTRSAEGVMQVMREIESAGKLPFTGILNNSNLGEETRPEDILSTVREAERLSKISGLPLAATCVREDLYEDLKDRIPNPVPVRLHFRKDWAIY